MERKEHNDPEKIVKQYFENIRALRKGDKQSVGRLVDMWDADGVFEFAGAPPLQGKYVGRTAILTLYSNRFHANGMSLKLESTSGKEREHRDVALGIVDTEVQRIKSHDGKIIAGWSTRIGTSDERGFAVAGSHTFTIRDEKISSLRVVVSPKPEKVENLRMEGLTVNDIGRLALAAWPVV